MISSIQRLFPALVDDFNTIYANLKDKEGLLGVDVIHTPGSTTTIRIIIEGIASSITSGLVTAYKELLKDKISGQIFWEEIIREFKKKERPPGANPKKSTFFSTIQPGINIGVGQNFGTLGLICFDTRTKQPCMLTAYHVVGNSNLFQPHVVSLRNLIGNFLRYDPLGDAAVYSFDRTTGPLRNFNSTGVVFNTTIIDTTVAIKTTEYPTLGEKLTKVGVVTNTTGAIIRGIGIYKHDRVGRTVWIEGFWLIPETPQNPDDEEISFQGDSGSVWYNGNTNAGVGLLIGGDKTHTPPFQEFAVAQHLSDVLTNLQIQLI